MKFRQEIAFGPKMLN